MPQWQKRSLLFASAHSVGSWLRQVGSLRLLMKTSSRFCFLCRLFWAVVVFLMNRNLCECASLFLFTSYGLCSEKSHCFTFLGIRTAVKT